MTIGSADPCHRGFKARRSSPSIGVGSSPRLLMLGRRHSCTEHPPPDQPHLNYTVSRLPLVTLALRLALSTDPGFQPLGARFFLASLSSSVIPITSANRPTMGDQYYGGGGRGGHPPPQQYYPPNQQYPPPQNNQGYPPPGYQSPPQGGYPPPQSPYQQPPYGGYPPPVRPSPHLPPVPTAR
jgi:hypothetical protein